MTKIEELIAALPAELQPLATAYVDQTAEMVSYQILKITDLLLEQQTSAAFRESISGLSTDSLVGLQDYINQKLAGIAAEQQSYDALRKDIIRQAIQIGLGALVGKVTGITAK